MPSRLPKPCSVSMCPNLTQGARCPKHEHDYRRSQPPRAPRLHYQGRWKWTAKKTVDHWIATNGPICPGYGVPAHESHDLTCDHIIPAVAGGTDDPSNRGVLCRSCNGRKGNDDKKRYGR